jgi:hypothetical protein
LEKLIGATLPKAYREFLSRYNGGYPTPYCFRYYDELSAEEYGSIFKFLGIGDESDFNTINYHLKYKKEEAREGLMPIALAYDGSSSLIYMLLNKTEFGKIYLKIGWIDPSDGNIFFVSDDFESFLNMLEDCPKDDEDVTESDEP